MLIWPRRACQLLTILVVAHGAWLCWRNFVLQFARLLWALAHVPAAPYPGCPAPFCDFSVFWLAGRMSSHPAVIYSEPTFLRASALMLPHGSFTGPFMYPPPALPLLYLISRLPIEAAYYAFMAASIMAAVLLLRQAKISWLCIIAGLLSPAGLWCMYLGQFGILCGALLFAGLAALESKPFRAGVLLGLLCIKPQYALLAPFVILSRANLPALRGAGIAAAALLAISGIWFGTGAWAAFLGAGGEAIRGQMEAPFAISPGRFGTSMFWMARSLGASLHGADMLQWLSSTLAGFLAWWLWRRGETPADSKIAITLSLALLVTPYGYTYDMVGYSLACALLMRRAAPATNLLLALLWHAPAYVGQFQMKFGFLPTPLCIITVALIGWWHLQPVSAPALPAPAARQPEPALSLPQTLSHPSR